MFIHHQMYTLRWGNHFFFLWFIHLHNGIGKNTSSIYNCFGM